MLVNGKEMDLIKDEITVTELLTKLNLSKDKVVVEVNGEIVPKEHYDNQSLSNGDKVEIVSFVGGG